jgi:hypothetical protein
MATHDVPLPSNRRPQFPDRCVSCEREHPGNTVRLSVTGAGTTPGAAESMLDLALGSTAVSSNRRVTVEAPACVGCGNALLRRHRWKTFWLYTGALGGTLLLLLILAGGGSVWFGLAALAMGILAPVIWELRWPPGFTFTPAGAQITYEFRSERVAQEFAASNPVDSPKVK